MKRAIPLLAYSTIAVAVSVTIGWLFNITFLKVVVPGFVTMKFSTAISFFFAGMSLLFVYKRELQKSIWADIIIPCTSLSVLILMGVMLFSILFGFTTGFDDLFVEQSTASVLTSVPGRPSIMTMMAFFLVAAMGLACISEEKWRKAVYFRAGSLVFMIGATAFLGYLFSQPLLYYAYLGTSNAMAIHTAFLFMLVGLGFVLLSRELRVKAVV